MAIDEEKRRLTILRQHVVYMFGEAVFQFAGRQHGIASAFHAWSERTWVHTADTRGPERSSEGTNAMQAAIERPRIRVKCPMTYCYDALLVQHRLMASLCDTLSYWAMPCWRCVACESSELDASPLPAFLHAGMQAMCNNVLS